MNETPQPDAPPAPEPAEVLLAKQRTMRLARWEGLTWAVMFGAGESYLAPFAVFLQAGHLALALLTSMPALIGALAQMCGAYLSDRFGLRRALLVPAFCVQALCYLPLLAIPLLWPAGAIPAVLLISALYFFAGNLGAPAWLSMMGDVVPEAERGDYFGRRGRMIIVGLLGVILATGALLGWFKDRHWTWAGFGLLFLLAGSARGFGARLLARHYDAPYRPSRDDYFSLWAFLRRTPQSNFAKFTFFFALMNGTTNIAGPFFIVYMLRDLHWTYVQFTVNMAVFFATQSLLLHWWGRIGDRYGNRAVLSATSYVLPFLPFFWAFSTNYYVLLVAQVVSGTAWSGFNLAAQNFILDAVSPQKRARVMGYVSLVNGVCVVLGSALIGAWLADHLPATYHWGPVQVLFVSSLPGVFVISGLARLVATIGMLPMFKEVRPAERVHPAALLLRLWSGEPLAGMFGQLTDLLVQRDRRSP